MVANRVLFEKYLVGQRMSETSRYIKRTGSSGFCSLGCIYLGSSFIRFFLLFLFYSFSFTLLSFGQNAPVSDPHTLPLVNKSDGRCCCRTRSSSVRCMLFMNN